MRFRAIVKDGKVIADIEAASCGLMAAEFVSRLSSLLDAEINVTEKDGDSQGVRV